MIYELEQAIKEAIEWNILGAQTLQEEAQAGDTNLVLGSTASFSEGNEIALYNSSHAETLTVCRILDEQTIKVQPALTRNWTSGGIQKLHEKEFVQFVVQGNPPSIPRYPAITVECMGNENEALTLGVGVFSQEFSLRVTCWAEKNSYSNARKQVQQLASKIELALFRTVFPLVRPWNETELAESMEPEQNFFIVENGLALVSSDTSFGVLEHPPYPIYLSTPEGRYSTQIRAQIGENEFSIDRLFNRAFPSGTTKIIRPKVHVYDSFCNGVTISENNENLIYADVLYRAKSARIRYSEPFIG